MSKKTQTIKAHDISDDRILVDGKLRKVIIASDNLHTGGVTIWTRDGRHEFAADEEITVAKR